MGKETLPVSIFRRFFSSLSESLLLCAALLSLQGRGNHTHMGLGQGQGHPSDSQPKR